MRPEIAFRRSVGPYRDAIRTRPSKKSNPIERSRFDSFNRTGGGPHVKIYDGKSGNSIDGPLGSFFAYDPIFNGGVSVASGDVDGDGWADVITAAGPGGGPHVKVFSGFSGEMIESFWAFAPEFGGGATVMAADFSGDGQADLAVGAGPGGGPHVKVFDLSTGETIPGPLGSFYAFDSGFSGGANVGTDYLTGDVSGDGRPDLVVGAGPGGGPNVRVFDGVSGAMIRDFQAFDASMNAGVRVTTAFVNDDQYADIVVGTGPGPTSQVKVFDGATSAELASPMSPYTPFGPTSTGGVSVAASNDPEGTLATLIPVPPSSIMQNTMYRFTVKLQEANSGNGNQTPSGTVTLWANGKVFSMTLVPVPNVPGQAIASGDVPENTFDVGTYSVQSGKPIYWKYNGDAWFLSNGTAYAPPLTVTAPLAISGDFDIIDSNGAEVAENKEESPGGWVPVNNDNDNYNFYGNQATILEHKLDKSETTKVVGENDLVKFSAHDLNTNGRTGTFKIVWYSPNIKVWKTADKDGQVLSGEAVPIGQTTAYWVEGLRLSEESMDEQIKLNFTDSIVGTVLIDRVNITVYEIKGAMNVPGYSKHRYEATTPLDSGFTATFVSATDGTVTNDGYYGGGPPAIDFAPVTAIATVFWGPGAVVGTYRVSPDQSLLNFFVDRQVNVVKVEFSAAAVGANELKYHNGPHAPKQHPYDKTLIYSSMIQEPLPPGSPPGTPQNPDQADPAMQVWLKVTNIEGPVVNGAMRGVKFIETGLIQNVKITKLHAMFNALAKSKYASSMEGKSYLDTLLRDPTTPWYLDTPVGAFVGVYRHPSDPAAAVTNILLSWNDTPAQQATNTMSASYQNSPPDAVDTFEIIINFDVFLAARTVEDSLGLGAETVYTQRGKASWWFDGSGDIDAAGKWTKRVLTTKNAGDGSLVEVSNGSIVPITVAPSGNKAQETQTWDFV